MRHIIKKQIIELSLDKRLNYFHVQQQVSDRYWNEIVPILEKSFDAISKEDELIEIDRFELDLGVISDEELGSRELMQDIKKKIKEKLATITDPVSSRYSARSRDRRLGIFEQWLFYMEHGYLAWNSDKPADKWYKDVLEILMSDSDSRGALRNKLLQNLHLLDRLVYLHNDDFLNNLTEIFSEKKQEKLQDYIDELLDFNKYLSKKKKIIIPESDNSLRNKLWQKILKEVLNGIPAGNLTNNLITSFILEKKYTSKLPAEEAGNFPLIMPVLDKFTDEIKRKRKKEKTEVEKAIAELRLAKKDLEDTKPAKEQVTGYNANVLDDEGIFVVNAGIVLLHPFLKTLFTRLELVKDNVFVDENARVTCIYLIHYLGTGRTEAEEFELVLAKILCGLPIESPVEPVNTLDPQFISEADMLIEAALSQWNILKNTSAAGLREGFLQRPGKLFYKNANIYLRVERKSIDVLLDYLPWNLSIIMLPWMKDVLRIEWR
jgi:Contractile injection system tape measure protein